MFAGQPVMLSKDLARLLGVSRKDLSNVVYLKNVHVAVLRGERLSEFKRENDYHSNASSLMLFYWTSATQAARALGVYEEHKAELAEIFEPFHHSNMSESEMRLAVKQADLIYKAAYLLDDKEAKNYAMRAVTKLLINIGLWDEKHPGYNGVTPEFSFSAVEGVNKEAVMFNANRRWPYQE